MTWDPTPKPPRPQDDDGGGGGGEAKRQPLSTAPKHTAKQHPDDPDGYVEMVDMLGSHRMARQSQELYSRLQDEEAVRFYEQWQNETTVLNLAKKEMRRWGTSGTDVSLNKVQRQMARSFEPPPLRGQMLETLSSDTRDAQALSAASRASYVSGCIEIVWQGMMTLQRPALLNTMMLQVFNLVSVRLPGNKLERLPMWFCKTFHKIKDLHLGSNDLIELPDNFGDMTSLVDLNLTHNNIPVLPPSVGRMTRLVTLTISDNELGAIPEQIGACHRLVTLHVDANNLTRLPSTVRKLPRLAELTIDCNRIGTLALIPSLERLKAGGGAASGTALLWEKRELGNGRIVFINRFTGEMKDTDPSAVAATSITTPSPAKASANTAPTLSSLAAADKTVWELKFDFRTGKSYYFNNLTRVRRLDVPPAIDTLGKTISLRRLVVSSNAMMHLPRSIGKLPSLEELVLDHNILADLPPSIAGLTRLTLLSVADNRLTTLPDEITTLPRLTKLAVNRNMIVALPLHLGNLTRLRSLFINNNAIEELPWTMGRMEGLKELMIGDNPVERRWRGVLEGEGKIPGMLQIMRELRLRAMHGKPPMVGIGTVGLLDEIIVPLPRKKKLWEQFCREAEASGYVDLHWNQLARVPPEILRIRSLVELRVSNNLLQELPLELGELVQLKLLHVTNNKRTLCSASGVLAASPVVFSLEGCDLSADHLFFSLFLFLFRFLLSQLPTLCTIYCTNTRTHAWLLNDTHIHGWHFLVQYKTTGAVDGQCVSCPVTRSSSSSALSSSAWRTTRFPTCPYVHHATQWSFTPTPPALTLTLTLTRTPHHMDDAAPVPPPPPPPAKNQKKTNPTDCFS
jgi:Leucine-rich repeat (LRR) protein